MSQVNGKYRITQGGWGFEAIFAIDSTLYKFTGKVGNDSDSVEATLEIPAFDAALTYTNVDQLASEHHFNVRVKLRSLVINIDNGPKIEAFTTSLPVHTPGRHHDNEVQGIGKWTAEGLAE